MCTTIVLLLALASGRAFAQSDMETRFLKEMDSLFDAGDTYYDAGYALQAEFFYGQAIVGIRSFQYALDRIAIMMVSAKETAQHEADKAASKAAIKAGPEKVDESVNQDAKDLLGIDLNGLLGDLNSFASNMLDVADKIEDVGKAIEQKAIAFGIDMDEEGRLISDRWNAISSLSVVSPYPYFFEGIVQEMSGNLEKAKSAYACAVCNPYIMRGRLDFTFLNDLTLEQLRNLWWRLENRATKYLNRVSVPSTPFPREWRNWNSAYLVCKGSEIMKNEEGEVSNAIPYFDAAVRANPFDKDLFVAAAAAHLMMGDVKGAVYYINQGLIVDPGNTDLLGMAADIS